MQHDSRHHALIFCMAAACAMCASAFGTELRTQREQARVLQGTLYVARSRYCPGDAQTDVLQLRLRLVVQNVSNAPVTVCASCIASRRLRVWPGRTAVGEPAWIQDDAEPVPPLLESDGPPWRREFGRPRLVTLQPFETLSRPRPLALHVSRPGQSRSSLPGTGDITIWLDMGAFPPESARHGRDAQDEPDAGVFAGRIPTNALPFFLDPNRVLSDCSE